MNWVVTAIGLAGAAAVVVAYALLLFGRLARTDRIFLLANAAGAAGILVSLGFRFNLAAALIEASWLAISLYGLVRPRPAREAPP